MSKNERKIPAVVIKILPFVIGAILVLVGVILMSLYKSNQVCSNTNPSIPSEDTFVIDYTNCIDEKTTYGNQKEQSCVETLTKNVYQTCRCNVFFNLTHDLNGTVIMYYELDWNEFKPAKVPNYYKSRDDNQLNGILSEQPSAACAPYDYDETPLGKRPIVPCGAIADAMFNDTFDIIKEFEYAVVVPNGIIREEDKKGFQNPPKNDNLTLAQVFQNFTKPKRWEKPIWETPNVTTSKGLEDEVFIGWMKTEWVRKPVGRLIRTDPYFKTGLRQGNDYTLVIKYNYPLTLYNGTRKLILSTCDINATYSSAGYGVGTGFLVVGLIVLLLASISMYITFKRRKFDTNMRVSEAEEAMQFT